MCVCVYIYIKSTNLKKEEVAFLNFEDMILFMNYNYVNDIYQYIKIKFYTKNKKKN